MNQRPTRFALRARAAADLFDALSRGVSAGVDLLDALGRLIEPIPPTPPPAPPRKIPPSNTPKTQDRR